MPSLPATSAEDVIDQSARVQCEAFLDEHREALRACLDGLTEEQARRRLVPSETTLLGLVKHATFVEKVWFDEAISQRTEPRSASRPHPTTRSSCTRRTRSPASSARTARPASRHDGLHRRWGSTTSSVGTVEDRCRFAGSICTCCGSSRSTAGMRTSCASRCWPTSSRAGQRKVPHQVTGKMRADTNAPSSTTSSPIVPRGCLRLSVGDPGLKARCPRCTSSHGMCE